MPLSCTGALRACLLISAHKQAALPLGPWLLGRDLALDPLPLIHCEQSNTKAA